MSTKVYMPTPVSIKWFTRFLYTVRNLNNLLSNFYATDEGNEILEHDNEVKN